MKLERWKNSAISIASALLICCLAPGVSTSPTDFHLYQPIEDVRHALPLPHQPAESPTSFRVAEASTFKNHNSSGTLSSNSSAVNNSKNTDATPKTPKIVTRLKVLMNRKLKGTGYYKQIIKRKDEHAGSSTSTENPVTVEGNISESPPSKIFDGNSNTTNNLNATALQNLEKSETRLITADQLSGNRPTQVPFHFTTTIVPPTTTRRTLNYFQQRTAGKTKNYIASLESPRKNLHSPHNHAYAPTQDPISPVDYDDLETDDYKRFHHGHQVFGSKVGVEVSTYTPQPSPKSIPIKKGGVIFSTKEFRQSNDEDSIFELTTTIRPKVRSNSNNLPFYKESGGIFKERDSHEDDYETNEVNQSSRFENKSPGVKYAPPEDRRRSSKSIADKRREYSKNYAHNNRNNPPVYDPNGRGNEDVQGRGRGDPRFHDKKPTPVYIPVVPVNPAVYKSYQPPSAQIVSAYHDPRYDSGGPSPIAARVPVSKHNERVRPIAPPPTRATSRYQHQTQNQKRRPTPSNDYDYEESAEDVHDDSYPRKHDPASDSYFGSPLPDGSRQREDDYYTDEEEPIEPKRPQRPPKRRQPKTEHRHRKGQGSSRQRPPSRNLSDRHQQEKEYDRYKDYDYDDESLGLSGHNEPQPPPRRPAPILRPDTPRTTIPKLPRPPLVAPTGGYQRNPENHHTYNDRGSNRPSLSTNNFGSLGDNFFRNTEFRPSPIAPIRPSPPDLGSYFDGSNSHGIYPTTGGTTTGFRGSQDGRRPSSNQVPLDPIYATISNERYYEPNVNIDRPHLDDDDFSITPRPQVRQQHRNDYDRNRNEDRGPNNYDRDNDYDDYDQDNNDYSQGSREKNRNSRPQGRNRNERPDDYRDYDDRDDDRPEHRNRRPQKDYEDYDYEEPSGERQRGRNDDADYEYEDDDEGEDPRRAERYRNRDSREDYDDEDDRRSHERYRDDDDREDYDEEEEEDEEDPREREQEDDDQPKKPPPKKPKSEKSGDLEDDILGIEREFGFLANSGLPSSQVGFDGFPFEQQAPVGGGAPGQNEGRRGQPHPVLGK